MGWWARRRWLSTRCLACGVQRQRADARYCESRYMVHLSGPGQEDPHSWPENQRTVPLARPWERGEAQTAAVLLLVCWVLVVLLAWPLGALRLLLLALVIVMLVGAAGAARRE